MLNVTISFREGSRALGLDLTLTKVPIALLLLIGRVTLTLRNESSKFHFHV